MGRNSAPAIAAAALLVAQTDPQAVLWLMAADAAITKPEALNAAMQNAIAGAEQGLVVTFGMKPTRPETGYGYIEVGETIPGLEGVSTVKAFREKPDTEQAEFFLKSGDYLWNSGMFVFKADTLIREMEEHAPEVMTAVRAAFEARKGDRSGPEQFPSFSFHQTTSQTECSFSYSQRNASPQIFDGLQNDDATAGRQDRPSGPFNRRAETGAAQKRKQRRIKSRFACLDMKHALLQQTTHLTLGVRRSLPIGRRIAQRPETAPVGHYENEFSIVAQCFPH